jgi:hypothetical protein
MILGPGLRGRNCDFVVSGCEDAGNKSTVEVPGLADPIAIHKGDTYGFAGQAMHLVVDSRALEQKRVSRY